MRILHVLQSLHPRFGGPPAVVLRLAAAQAEMGAKVGLLSYRDTTFDGAIERSVSIVPNIERVRRIDVEPESGRIGRVLASSLGSFIRSQAREWDIVHLHNVWDPVVRAGAAAARSAGLPYVITPHGSLDPWAMRQRPLKRLKKIVALQLQMRSLLDGAVFLHVLNDDERTGLSELHFRAPTVVVANGISLQELKDIPAPGSFRARMPEIGQQPFVLFLSRIHFKKGLDILVDAFAPLCEAHPGLRLVVAGPDDGALQANLDRARQLGVLDRVSVVGPLYGKEKYAALTDATVFCLPSRMEGFSIAILEALACSCPVVISRDCHFPEVGAARAGAVVPLHHADVSSALATFLDQPDAARSAGARGRSLVEQHYTWPVIAAQLIEGYSKHVTPGAA